MKFFSHFRDCTGAVAVVTAITIPVLFGFSSLGIEVSHWYLTQRVMQGAADAAVISAAAEYVAQYNANAGSPGTSYQTVGQHYAFLNGYSIPTANVCLIDPSGVDGCGAVEALDARPIICSAPPCVVVEITQNTAEWPTTQASLEPTGNSGQVQAIPTPTLLARAVASVKINTATATGGDCILALANDPEAILLHGTGADPNIPCGIAIDGGRDQNAGTPIVGGITFQGNSKINANALVVAASTANCPDGGVHCQQYGSTAPLTNVSLNTATPDPYAAAVAALFKNPPPQAVNGITIKNGGSGYAPNATCTVTLTDGTYYGTTASPAVFQVGTNKNGTINSVRLIDPGAYAGTTAATMPTGTKYTITGCGTPSTAATFNAPTQGCWTYTGSVTPIPNRTYCSINLQGATGTINFPAGNYWIAGGDSNGKCSGFCVSSNNTTVTSDPAGVTFFLTNGDGATGDAPTTQYASVGITSGSISLCAPGTNCGQTCTLVAGNPASCMLFLQNPAAPTSTGNGSPPSTDNTLTGNGDETLSGLIYFSKQSIDIGGGTNPHGCVAVIARYLDIGGSPIFDDGCLPGGGIGSTVTSVLASPYLSQ